MANHRYSPEQIDWLRARKQTTMIGDLTAQFNAAFGLGLTKSAVSGSCKRFRILKCDPNSGRFAKGGTPWNKGKKGLQLAPATQFKKGQKSLNAVPVGTETILSDGYTKIKIAEPRTWQFKHVLLWEQKNGKRPARHVILFADGDKLNFNPDNLVLVHRKELVRLNKERFSTLPNPLKPAFIATIKLEGKARDLMRPGKQGRQANIG